MHLCILGLMHYCIDLSEGDTTRSRPLARVMLNAALQLVCAAVITAIILVFLPALIAPVGAACAALALVLTLARAVDRRTTRPATEVDR